MALRTDNLTVKQKKSLQKWLVLYKVKHPKTVSILEDMGLMVYGTDNNISKRV